MAELVCVCVRTEGPMNLGLISRLCANLGLPLRLVDPRCDRNSDEARRFANKTADALQDVPVHADLAAAVADCHHIIGTSARPREQELGPALTLPAVQPWLQTRGTGLTALVFGNEATGLSDAELRLCHAFVQLAMPGSYQSYNLSSAVSIVLYHLATVEAAELAVTDEEAIRSDEREALQRYWLGTLDRFGYFEHFGNQESFSRKFKHLLNRLPLRPEDGQILRACLSQFNFKHFGDKAPEMAKTGKRPESPSPEKEPTHE